MKITTQEEIEKINTALEFVAQVSTKTDQAVQIHDVDYLEVEVLELPIIDLNKRYMFRIAKPLNLVMSEDVIKLAHPMTQINFKSYEERLKDELLSKWRIMLVEWGGIDFSKAGDEKSKAFFQKWYEIEKVNLVELKLVRDE